MKEQTKESNIKELITKDIEKLKKNFKKEDLEELKNSKNTTKTDSLFNYLKAEYGNKLNSKESASIVEYTAELFNSETKTGIKNKSLDKLKEEYPVAIKKKRKQKKKRIPKIKNKEYASITTSELSSKLKDEYKSTGMDINKKEITTEKKQTKSGTISMNQHCKEINPNDINFRESDILKRYQTIAINRESLQLYFAILNTYITNVKNKDYGKPLEIRMNDLHKDILCKTGHIQKRDIEKYRALCTDICIRRITFSASTAELKPYSTRKFKNDYGEVDSNLLQIDVTTDIVNQEQSIKIIPTTYTLMELTRIKQVSNFCPNEFLSLDFKRHENIFYFGLYLVRIHTCNQRHKVKGKVICNTTYAWEQDLKGIIENALPDYKFKKLLEEYKETGRKKEFILSNIEKPLNEAIAIMEKNKYILEQKTKRIEINYRRAFDTNMIKFIFNYDVGKLLKPVFKDNADGK